MPRLAGKPVPDQPYNVSHPAGLHNIDCWCCGFMQPRAAVPFDVAPVKGSDGADVTFPGNGKNFVGVPFATAKLFFGVPSGTNRLPDGVVIDHPLFQCRGLEEVCRRAKVDMAEFEITLDEAVARLGASMMQQRQA